MSVFDSIKQPLDTAGVPYTTHHHEPTPTSADSARVRGSNLHEGGKSLVIKGGDKFVLCVLPASNRLDAKKVEQLLGVKKIRFATKEELFALTGLVPGSVPPFGEPILSLPFYLDTAITKNEKINFNAGSLTDSIDMLITDYLTVAKPRQILDLSEHI